MDDKRTRTTDRVLVPGCVDDAWNKPVTKYSDYLGLETCDDPEAALALLANANTAIGGYREGITILPNWR